MSIHRLPQEVVNQIAAGEVVERPANLLKELLENSLDAKASRIEVEIEQGGRWLRVKDNGLGMSAADIVLAVEPHATSKIRVADDLWQLASFGFRGEALASIAAISKLSITSRPTERDEAARLRVDFGVKQDLDWVGGEVGTEIVVEQLFDNVPARLKFLKSDSAEVSQIKNVLKALALANPPIEMRVRYRGELLYYWPAQETRQQRFIQVLEQPESYVASGQWESYASEITFAPPHITTGNGRQIWLFVQGRWVQDRRLQAAVLEAYRSLLMHGEFPIAAVWMTCDPQDIDVNIHPTKSQVKFRSDQGAFRAVHHGLRTALEAAPWVQRLLKTDGGRTEAGIENGVRLYTETRIESEESEGTVRQPTRPYFNMGFNDANLSRVQYQQKKMSYIESLTQSRPSAELPPTTVSHQVPIAVHEQPASPRELTMVSADVNAGPWSSLQILGQAHQTYIVAQSDRALVFVDQHAAHERVAFERLMQAWRGGRIEVQELLLPMEVEIEEEAAEALISIAEDLKRAGLDVERLGPSLLGIKSMPSLLREGALVRTLQSLGREMVAQGDSFALERAIANTFATMACHSVVRAGQALSAAEMQSLLAQMDEFPMSSFCPHGRPVFVEYPFSRIERDFGRIV